MRKFLLLLLIIIFCNGCTVQEPAPLPEIKLPVRMVTTPATSYLAQAANSCSLENSEIGINVDVLPLNEIESANYDLIITSGEGLTDWQFQLAEESLVFIVNSNNPVAGLNQEEILKILTGYITQWDEIAPGKQMDDPSKLIQVYLFSDKDDLTNLVTDQLPDGTIINPRTRYLPGPLEITQAVQGNPAGIGILPARWLSDLIKPLSTDLDIRYPIVMSVHKDPAGSLRDLMSCIQIKMDNPED